MDHYDGQSTTNMLQHPGSAETGSWFPCYDIPFVRNRSFRGRQAKLSEVTSHLAQGSPHPDVKTFALWGIGGTGKTQIALEYAYMLVYCQEFHPHHELKGNHGEAARLTSKAEVMRKQIQQSQQ
ncbi:hypothetical protein AJ80_06790 [Polytolypa hystricis UAMH7299]|uniref:NB-ARC domain-containing protein n=1 Tax=Polytolypa hystricis (strain UAMH7299) TaxID=1447883 RepID=A0A2B7XSU4_POLH7|nr:hypothetical protein AJ80_06790 [Polytolypa hystricis UAMH7299]